MSYTPAQKHAALTALAANHDDVDVTATQLGIPVRTLYRWRRALHQQELAKLAQMAALPKLPPEKSSLTMAKLPALPKPAVQLADPAHAEAKAADTVLETMLNHMMTSAFTFSTHLLDNLDEVPPASQVIALTRLIDRILKLDARMPRYQEKGSNHVTITYQHEDGSVSNAPPWAPDDPLWDWDLHSTRVQKNLVRQLLEEARQEGMEAGLKQAQEKQS